MRPRNDQDVRRSLRAEVVKGDANIVLKNLLRRYLTTRDLAKNAALQRHNRISLLQHNGLRLLSFYRADSVAASAMFSVIRSMSAPSERSLRTMVSYPRSM